MADTRNEDSNDDLLGQFSERAFDLLGEPDVPETIGPYRIVEPLGEGGMGVVYKAEQLEPVRRVVAVKLIKLGMDSKSVLARFDLERRALAAMNHPSIAKVFDAGTTDRGQPYFAMEFVEGTPINQFCDQHRMPLEQRIRLFQEVCAGVQHAHQKGVVHRDLKPGNVLVAPDSGKSLPKVLDFGLAKATNRDLGAGSFMTEPEHVMGTPEYMAPEQATGDSEIIDTRADVYSLGVMLYELLTGVLPFSRKQLRKGGWIATQELLRTVEPPKPSSRIQALEDSAKLAREEVRRVREGGLWRRLRGDLDWIVMKALEKDPERRYESADALSNDLARFLEHEPVLAGPPSASYRLRKLARRYRTEVLAATAVLLTAILGAVFAIDYAVLADQQRESAQANLDRYNLLRNVVLLRKAKAAESTTWPARPDKREAISSWLRDRGEPLLAALPELIDALREEEARTGLSGDEQIEHEFLRDTLRDLVRDLRAFEHEVFARVRQRERWANAVTDWTLAHPHARVSWDDARAAIAAADGRAAHARYQGSPDLVPQCGLVPIGMNPATKLWEFYHLRSAWAPTRDTAPQDLPIPEHDADGHIEVGNDTGIVFVLVPGGTFWMGAQSDHESAPNFDPDAAGIEAPHEVTLAPYFVARHELTQGQYVRLTGATNPSQYRPGWGATSEGMPSAVALNHPVEQIDWMMSDRVLRLHGLSLPTESQWEYACRAGTSSPWWTGRERDSLIAHGVAANLADRAAARARVRWRGIEAWPELDDGWAVHARVDALRANAWGLHHVHGNVWEWCQDWYGSYRQNEPAEGNGLRTPEGSTSRVSRGGSFSNPAREARASTRVYYTPGLRATGLGCRAARAFHTNDFRASR